MRVTYDSKVEEIGILLLAYSKEHFLPMREFDLFILQRYTPTLCRIYGIENQTNK